MKRIALIGVLSAVFGLTACQTHSPDYKANETLIQQLPAKPDADDPRIPEDETGYQKGLTLRATERGVIAGQHHDVYKVPQLEAFYAPVVGHELSEQATPAFHKLLTRLYVVTHEMARTLKASNYRARPYAVHPEDQTCRPDMRAKSHPNHSYPSGHTVSAYSAALILARIYPEKADAVAQMLTGTGVSG